MGETMLHKKLNFSKSIFFFPILLVFYEIAMYLSNDAYLPGLPYIAQDLKTSAHMVQLTLTFWFAGSGSMQLLLGPLSDRVGRRPVLLFGGLIFIISTVGCAFSHEIYSLLLWRFIEGASIASMAIAGYSTVHELFAREKAIHTLALMNSVTLLAPAFGPLLGAAILYKMSWHWIFGILAIWSSIIISALFFTMPETLIFSKKKISLKAIFHQYKNIVSNKSFVLLAITPLFLFSAIIAWIAAGPFLLMDYFHWSATHFGLVQVLIFSGLILGARCVKRAMKYLTIKAMTGIGLGISSVGGLYVLGTSLLWPNIVWNMIIGMMLVACGMGLIFPVFNRLAVESSEEPMGSRMAILSIFACFFGTIGSAIIGSIFNGTLFSLGIIICLFTILPVVLRGSLAKSLKSI